MEKDNKKLNKQIKKKNKTSLSSRINKTGEDIAMLEEKKQIKKRKDENICDRHWDGA